MRPQVTIPFLLCLLLAATSIGSSQNFWDRINGPQSAHVTCLAVVSGNAVFAGTEKGILRSTDNGESWEESGLADVSVKSLAIAPNGYIFAATNSPWVWRSTDNGSSWQSFEIVNSNLERCSLFSLGCNATGDLIATTDAPQVNAIYRSTDYGEHWTWQYTTASPSSGSPGHVVLDNSGNAFAGPVSPNRLFVSTDHGVSWWARPLPTVTNVACLAMSSRGHLFVGGLGNVVRSTDCGLSWTSATSGLAGLAVLDIAAGSGDTMFAATYPDGVARSTDNGLTWAPTALGHAVAAVAMNSVGTLFAGRVSIFRSSNCGNDWSRLEAGWQDLHVTSLVANRGDTLYTAGAGEGIFTSTDHGISWSELPTGLRHELIAGGLAISPQGHLFVAVYRDFVWQYLRSTDNGRHWVGLNTGALLYPVFNDSGHIFATYLTLGIEGYGYIGVKRSMDNGETWGTITTGLRGDIITTVIINGSGDLFVGTDEGIYRSTNRGELWTAVNSGLTDKVIRGLAVSRSGHLFAATGTDYADKVFRSSDNGENWVHQFSLPRNSGIRAMVADAGGKVFIALDSMGVYLNGVKCNGGLDNLIVRLLALDHGGYLYAATDGGIFRSRISTTGVVELPRELPATYRLEQNYPNPFNPGTIISSRLAVASHVKLVVYDLLGREVATLVNEKRAAGMYQDFFDGSGLASGVYIYRLTAGQFIDSRRMILLK